jgi:amino acid permease
VQTFIELQGESGGFLSVCVGSTSELQQLLAMIIFGGAALPLCFKDRLSELRHVSLLVVVFCVSVALIIVGKSVAIVVQV